MLPLVTFNGICICIPTKCQHHHHALCPLPSPSSAHFIPTICQLHSIASSSFWSALDSYIFLYKYLRGILSGFFILSDLCRFAKSHSHKKKKTSSKMSFSVRPLFWVWNDSGWGAEQRACASAYLGLYLAAWWAEKWALMMAFGKYEK